MPGHMGIDGGPFGNGLAIAAAAAMRTGIEGMRNSARRGPRRITLKSLAQLKGGKGEKKAVGTAGVAGPRGKSTHACAGGRVKNHRIGNTGFFLGCNNIEEGAKIIIYGDHTKYTVGPNGLEN